MRTITDILYKEKPEHTFLPTVILVSFDNYNGPTVTNIDGIKVVHIVPIRRMWEVKLAIALAYSFHFLMRGQL